MKAKIASNATYDKHNTVGWLQEEREYRGEGDFEANATASLVETSP